MDDGLIIFATARLDEEEAAARKAMSNGNGEWHVKHHDCANAWGGCDDPCPDAAECAEDRCLHCEVEGEDIYIYNEGGHDEDQAAHIARYGPARALREIAFKRALIKSECAPYPEGCAPATRTLRLLVAVWSQHPDYKEAWRP